ncbi:MAG: L-seryl-tRNA(Sec) selenium transferase [Armatimonadetes bacterium]|nr:L-seryl-tRNA(Sec) selenium transferase [Armatimonadota bacterium]
MNQELLRKLPSIDEIMNTQGARRLIEEHDRDVVVDAARVVVDQIRSEVIRGGDTVLSPDAILGRVASYLRAKFSPSLKHAINAAGIILHTGLGRAMLPKAAVDAVNDVIKGYCTLAADLENGQRTTRDVHFSDILCELTGAEAATIANNNAAATMLVLNTLARGKEVIVSRGQLVEIGGAFRMPDVMEQSGAIMREVGTTNKTHLRDYAAAINENTGAILRVHMSNYRIVGFFEEPGIEELTNLAHDHNIPIIDDLGSGALVDLNEFGLESEPMIRDSIRAGVDVACFSGDKLIGGPQCGIMVGKADVIKAIKKNPLSRAMRVGKLEVAALEATLKLFLDREKLYANHPTYKMFSMSVESIENRAIKVVKKISGVSSDIAEISVIDGTTQVGSGSVPAQAIPTKLLSVRPITISASAFAKKLRYYDTPVFARIHQDAVLLDFRTIQPGEDATVAKALVAVASAEL